MGIGFPKFMYPASKLCKSSSVCKIEQEKDRYYKIFLKPLLTNKELNERYTETCLKEDTVAIPRMVIYKFRCGESK